MRLLLCKVLLLRDKVGSGIYLKGAIILVLLLLFLLPVALGIHQCTCHQHQESCCLREQEQLSDAASIKPESLAGTQTE